MKFENLSNSSRKSNFESFGVTAKQIGTANSINIVEHVCSPLPPTTNQFHLFTITLKPCPEQKNLIRHILWKANRAEKLNVVLTSGRLPVKNFPSPL